jgi:predicted RNase H-like HicB family nuclease
MGSIPIWGTVHQATPSGQPSQCNGSASTKSIWHGLGHGLVKKRALKCPWESGLEISTGTPYERQKECAMDFVLEFEQETDGRWIAEIPELPGVLAYGLTRMQAGEKAKALALRVLAERVESESPSPA